MNKELVAYTSFSQVTVHQKIVVFFYPTKLVRDLLELYIIVCGKLVYVEPKGTAASIFAQDELCPLRINFCFLLLNK